MKTGPHASGSSSATLRYSCPKMAFLMPRVQMGIEARDQVTLESGEVEDAATTRLDHPLVKYAEDFSHYFDLIAERKSVIFHLRELAKASVLAKYITESGLVLGEPWYQLGDEADSACCLEVPQLWNERRFTQIQVQDGTIVNEEPDGREARQHLVYGGVHFGLERFTVQSAALSRPRATLLLAGGAPTISIPSGIGRTFTAGMAMGHFIRRGPMSLAPPSPALVELTPIPPMQAPLGYQPNEVPPHIYNAWYANRLLSPDFSAPTTQPEWSQVERVARAPTRAPQRDLAGVDLNLDSFDLSSAAVVHDGLAESECRAMGKAFWATLDGSAATNFKDEDRTLLASIFNPYLSDRRDEGERFLPPETSSGHVAKLRALVKEEQVVRDRRKHVFLSQDFVVEDPGSLFPPSWKSSFEIAHGADRATAAGYHDGPLYERQDYKAEVSALAPFLQSSVPSFDKTAEDGARFRIYRFGALEVRSVQEHGGEEVVGAVYSSRAPNRELAIGTQEQDPPSAERLAKATVYVEGGLPKASSANGAQRSKVNPEHRHMYAVLETARGNVIVTEKMEDGTVTWEVNPRALDIRISLSKVLSSAEATESVGDVQRFVGQQKEDRAAGTAAGPAARKVYAEAACRLARAGPQQAPEVRG